MSPTVLVFSISSSEQGAFSLAKAPLRLSGGKAIHPKNALHRIKYFARSPAMFLCVGIVFDIFHDVANRLDVLDLLIRDFGVELFLEAHHQVNKNDPKIYENTYCQTVGKQVL